MALIPVEIADQYQDLFNIMRHKHDLLLTIEEMDEIIHESLKVKANIDALAKS